MSRRNSTASKPSQGSPNIDEVIEKPLDAFTQELVRENELLIADLDNLRENEDRLISQIEKLQQQLSLAENNKHQEIAELQALLQQKDAELHKSNEELVSTRHTLAMYEDSGREHAEQMDSVEAELEDARNEIQRLQDENERLQALMEENIATQKEESASGATATSEAINKGVTSSLSEMNSNAKFLHATVQSIYKSVRGNLLFSTYGDPLAPFENQPTPSLSITDRDIPMKEADIAKYHKKIVETIRRIEGFVTMADARCEELGMAPETHPFRVFVSTCVEGCSLLLSLFVGMSKIGLLSARNHYNFTDGNAANVAASPGQAITTATSAPATASQTATGANPAEKPPSTSRGLGLWVR